MPPKQRFLGTYTNKSNEQFTGFKLLLLLLLLLLLSLLLLLVLGNFMTNHLGHDTLTSQILFTFSLFVDSNEMINL